MIIALEVGLKLKNRNIDLWTEEDLIINEMNFEKFISEDNKLYPLLIHENEKIERKTEGIKRILFIGDSYVWGDGYSNLNHTWWKQFSYMLKENGYNDVEVYAAGVSGYSTKDELNNILKNKDLINTVDPDFIIVSYVVNDPEDELLNSDIRYVETDDLWYDSNNKILKFVSKIVPNIYKTVCQLIAMKFQYNDKFIEKYGYTYSSFIKTINSDENLINYEKNEFVPMIDYLRNDLKIPFVFEITSTSFNEPNIDNIIFMMKKYDVKYYYPAYLNDILGESVKKGILNRINPANSHPSVLSCNNYARYLYLMFKEDYKEMLGEKTEYIPKFSINDWMPYSLVPEKIDENTYQFTYPEKGKELSFLTLPINKEYIKLNLEEPYNINQISISCEDLSYVESIEIYINKINLKLGYDDQKMESIGKKDSDFVWNLNRNDRITSINISAKIKNGQEKKLVICVK